MRVVITGGAGFLGGVIANALASTGVEVTACGRTAPAPDWLRPEVRWRQAVLGCGEDVPPGLFDADCIVHAAGSANAREQRDIAGLWNDCVASIVSVLRGVPSKRQTPHVVLMSSTAVYGDHRDVLDEDTSPQPTTPYGRAKQAAEQVLLDATEAARVAGVVLRVSTAAGAVGAVTDLDATHLLPQVARLVAGYPGHLDVYGDGSARRDFIHPLDVAAAVLRLIGHEVDERLMMCASGRSLSVQEVINRAEVVTGVPIPVRRHAAAQEQHSVVVDNSRLRSLGWAPDHSDIESILRELIDYWTIRKAAETAR